MLSATDMIQRILGVSEEEAYAIFEGVKTLADKLVEVANGDPRRGAVIVAILPGYFSQWLRLPHKMMEELLSAFSPVDLQTLGQA